MFVSAIYDGDLQQLEDLLQKDPQLLSISHTAPFDSVGEHNLSGSALAICVDANRLEVFNFLVAHGAQPLQVVGSDAHCMTEEKLLLRAFHSERQNNALIEAICRAFPSQVTSVIGDYGEHPLFLAAASNSVTACRLFVEEFHVTLEQATVPVTEKNLTPMSAGHSTEREYWLDSLRCGATPLHAAAYSRCSAALVYLAGVWPKAVFAVDAEGRGLLAYASLGLTKHIKEYVANRRLVASLYRQLEQRHLSMMHLIMEKYVDHPFFQCTQAADALKCIAEELVSDSFREDPTMPCPPVPIVAFLRNSVRAARARWSTAGRTPSLPDPPMQDGHSVPSEDANVPPDAMAHFGTLSSKVHHLIAVAGRCPVWWVAEAVLPLVGTVYGAAEMPEKQICTIFAEMAYQTRQWSERDAVARLAAMHRLMFDKQVCSAATLRAAIAACAYVCALVGSVKGCHFCLKILGTISTSFPREVVGNSGQTGPCERVFPVVGCLPPKEYYFVEPIVRLQILSSFLQLAPGDGSIVDAASRHTITDISQQTDSFGNTILHLLAIRKLTSHELPVRWPPRLIEEAINLVLAAGIDVRKKNCAGLTALEVSQREGGCPIVASLLLSVPQ